MEIEIASVNLEMQVQTLFVFEEINLVTICLINPYKPDILLIGHRLTE